MLALHVTVHILYKQVFVQTRPVLEHNLCRIDAEPREVLALLLGRHAFHGPIHTRNGFQHRTLPEIDHLAYVGRHHVITQVCKIRDTVEEPECRRGAVLQHRAVTLGKAFGHLGSVAIYGCQARSGGIVHTEPQNTGLAGARLPNHPETGLLRSRCTLVYILLTVNLERHGTPAIRQAVASGAQILGHIHRRTLEMVAHGIEDLLGRDLGSGLNPQRHTVGGIVTHSIVDILVHIVGECAEEAPHTRLTGTHGTEIQRSIRVAEREIGIVARVVSLLACERDNVWSIEAVVGIILREGGYTGLICVCADISVGDTARNPHDTLVTRALAYELHDPRLLGVGYREALARRCVSVGVRQIDYDVDSLTRRAGTLQGDIYQ